MRAPQHVHVNIEHEPGVAAKVGHGLALRSERDGFYGSFRIHNTPVGETALELIRGGALGGVSMEAEFRPRWNRVVDGVVQRVRANLKNVALCRDPAYTGALILG